MLIELKHYLRRHRRASLQDLENRFDMPADALRGALQQWIRKGRVQRVESAGCGGSCSACNPQPLEYYEWRNPLDQRLPGIRIEP